MGLVTEKRWQRKKKIHELENRSIEIMQYFIFVNVHFFYWEKMNSILEYHGTTSTNWKFMLLESQPRRWKNMRAAGEIRHISYLIGKPIKTTADFSFLAMWARDSGITSWKYWKKRPINSEFYIQKKYLLGVKEK